MSTTRDFDRRAAAWLATGPTELSDRVLDAALREVHVTHQRRRWPAPWRTAQMPTYMRLAAGIAIVAVVGLGALVFFNDGPDVGPPPTTAPTGSVRPTAIAGPPLLEGPLTPGRYLVAADGVRAVVTVPANWTGTSAASLGKPPFELPAGVNLSFAQPTTVFTDPCDPETTAVPLGPAVGDLVTALSDLPHVINATEAQVTISGYSGTHLYFRVDTDGIDCVMGIYGQGSFIRAAENGQRQDLWILDVAGTRLVIDGAVFPETLADDRAELQAIVDTLVIQSTD